MARKNGDKMSDSDRRSKSFKTISDYVVQFIRRDFGGQDPVDALAAKAEEWARRNGLEFSPTGLRYLGMFAAEMAEEQLKGVRGRVQTPLDEIRRRIEILGTVYALLEESKAKKDSHMVQAIQHLENILHGEGAPVVNRLATGKVF